MKRVLFLSLLFIAGCGSSSQPAATPTSPATAVPSPLPTPLNSTMQVLVDQSGKGTRGNYSDNYIFTVPQGYYRLTWSFHCPSNYSFSVYNFVVFSSIKRSGGPLLDPGVQELSGSGQVAQSTSPGSRVRLSVIAYEQCRYHVHVVG